MIAVLNVASKQRPYIPLKIRNQVESITTYLAEFLSKFEPVSIAWYLSIDKDGISNIDGRQMIACYCVSYAAGIGSIR